MPPCLIIDLRCLQDPDYAERGIGNHARCIINAAPEPFIGLIDPTLPPLPEDITARAASLTPHAYLPAIAQGSVFLNPSPMGRDPLALARLLRDPNITKAAVVYDFIPYDAQETYLTTPARRLEYATALAWLRQYDVFFPISAASQARLFALFGPVRTHITGVALSDWMHDIPPEPPRHIFMAGGGDTRKNPETLARAHAASPVLRQIPLIIGGSCTPETAARLRAITQVSLPGHVANADLRRLFAQAYCVVTPSYAEGFSLPVIEAMAAHSPAIVSDIPQNREFSDEFCWRVSVDLDVEHEQLVKAMRHASIATTQRYYDAMQGDAAVPEVFAALARMEHRKPRANETAAAFRDKVPCPLLVSPDRGNKGLKSKSKKENVSTPSSF
ncbi:MAG: hypothetical protein B7Z81_08275, partial [Acidocella sp. 20-61-6]